jgi:hypothetical protein
MYAASLNGGTVIEGRWAADRMKLCCIECGQHFSAKNLSQHPHCEEREGTV